MRVATLLRERRVRERYFPPCALDEPAWGMLLEIAGTDRISVTGAIDGAGAPTTTGLRHLGLLIGAGIVQREDDPLDRRRSWLSLTEAGRDAMGDYLSATHREAA